LRQQLIDELRHQGIRDENVLEAMVKLPRHLFLEKAFEEWAYKNVAFPIGCDQTYFPTTDSGHTDFIARSEKRR
jgi:protein-L-isoaspartate(D-aspartate) O-methyltransferase